MKNVYSMHEYNVTYTNNLCINTGLLTRAKSINPLHLYPQQMQKFVKLGDIRFLLSPHCVEQAATCHLVLTFSVIPANP